MRESSCDGAGAPEFGRTAYGTKRRHVIRTHPCAPYRWPAVSWCGRRLIRPASDAYTLCGTCERILANEEDRRRAAPDSMIIAGHPTAGR